MPYNKQITFPFVKHIRYVSVMCVCVCYVGGLCACLCACMPACVQYTSCACPCECLMNQRHCIACHRSDIVNGSVVAGRRLMCFALRAIQVICLGFLSHSGQFQARLSWELYIWDIWSFVNQGHEERRAPWKITGTRGQSTITTVRKSTRREMISASEGLLMRSDRTDLLQRESQRVGEGRRKITTDLEQYSVCQDLNPPIALTGHHKNNIFIFVSIGTQTVEIYSMYGALIGSQLIHNVIHAQWLYMHLEE